MGGSETPPEQVNAPERLAGDQEALWLLPSIRLNLEVCAGSRVVQSCTAAPWLRADPWLRAAPRLSQRQLCTLFALTEQHKWLPVDKDFSTRPNMGAL